MDNGNPKIRKYRKREQLRQHHMPRDDLARQEREKGAKCKQTSKPIVDWSFLLKLNPPPGYTPCDDKSSTGLSNTHKKNNDPVITILQKILRDLEKDIREEKRNLRVSCLNQNVIHNLYKKPFFLNSKPLFLSNV